MVRNRAAKSSRTSLVALLQRAFTIDGRVFVDCYDPMTGRDWKNSPLMVLGGGPDSYVFAAPESPTGVEFLKEAELEDSTQVVLLSRDGAKPMCIGTVQHPKQNIVDDPVVALPTQDHDGTVSIRDYAVTKGGTTVIIHDNGDVTVKGAGTIRMQSPEGGIVRMSRDGDASERLLLAQATLNYMEEVDTFMRAVDTWATNLKIASSSGLPITPFTSTPPTLNRDTLVAALVHVAADSEA
jgi:hypothetical protein